MTRVTLPLHPLIRLASSPLPYLSRIYCRVQCPIYRASQNRIDRVLSLVVKAVVPARYASSDTVGPPDTAGDGL